MNRRFNPLPEGHPTIGEECVACRQKFKAGDVTTIVAIGPGSDPEKQEAAREGRAYAAIGVIAHYSCVTGEP